MRTRLPSFLKTKMAAIFFFQAVLVWGLDWPALVASRNRVESFQFIEWLGFAVGVGATAGEAVADRQLKAFKHDPGNRDQVCAIGLWRYSRHPNYFFEWLFWTGIALVAWPSPQGEYGILAPLLMLIFLGGITGIPPTERQSLRSKGERYRKYQETTSAFFLWPPRSPTRNG
jgi:steroid 5-alpha reductase family enzyme